MNAFSSKNMKNDKRNRSILRIFIAGIVAMAVTGVCLNLSCSLAGRQVRYSQYSTEYRLEKTDNAIKIYRQKKGALPRSLAELKAVPDFPFIGEDGHIMDSWFHPIEYQLQENHYLLVSYGRDAKPGGIGLDCDLSNVNPHPPAARIPFYQVLFDPSAQDVVLISLLCGVATFLLTFFTVTPASLSRERRGDLALQLAATLIGSLFIAYFVTSIISSGH